jgi:hypothetical protein
LNSIYTAWYGTPYRLFHRKVGIGADCREFVTAVLDEVHGRAVPTVLPIGPWDVARHQPNIARKFAAFMLRKFPLHRVRASVSGGQTVRAGEYTPPSRDGAGNAHPAQILEIMAGDIIVCRISRGPGHVAMVGTGPGQIWHASQKDGKVVMTGPSCLPEILAVYRSKDIAAWDDGIDRPRRCNCG